MNKLSNLTLMLAGALLTLAAGVAQAQATRTWVSGVGDDVNPCSRTAPCKTFAGAISRTADGGEISVLDPGGYGAVTITKSITIDGGQGAGFASVLSAGTTGIIINAPGAAVTLRNISINGAGSGFAGIRIIAAAKVFIENLEISGHAGFADPGSRGISDTRTTGGQLIVRNTIVRHNAQSGIVIQPASGSTTIDVDLQRVSLVGNGNAGLAATNGAHVTMVGCNASGNGSIGIYAEQLAGGTQVFVADSSIADNMTGIFLSTGAPVMRLSNVIVTNNDTGVSNVGMGTIFSYGNNRVSGNTTGNTPGVTPLSPL